MLMFVVRFVLFCVVCWFVVLVVISCVGARLLLVVGFILSYVACCRCYLWFVVWLALLVVGCRRSSLIVLCLLDMVCCLPFVVCVCSRRCCCWLVGVLCLLFAVRCWLSLCGVACCVLVC